MHSPISTILKHNPDMPIIAKAGGRQFVNSINFMLITMAAAMKREDLRINPESDIDGGIDAYSEILNGAASQRQGEDAMEEMGVGKSMNSWERGKRLKSLRAYVDEQLHLHATPVYFELSQKTGPNPYEIGDPIETTLRRQIERAPRELTSAMKAEAKALGLPEEAILQGLERQRMSNVEFMTANRHHILDIIGKFECPLLDEESVEGIWDGLPAMDRFRLYAAIDSGLYYAALQQGQRWIVNKVQEGKDNLVIINAERINFRKEINEFLKDPTVKREVSDALAVGATPPVLQALPPSAEQLAAAKKLEAAAGGR